MTQKTSAPSAGPISDSPSRLEARTDAILRATLEELAAVGYASLSFEAVASRVGIAKTTVYRRYPTKRDLVQAAVHRFVNSESAGTPDTGSLRGDLIAVGRRAVSAAMSAGGQGLFRLGVECPEPELAEMSKDFEARTNARDMIVASRAVTRGELSASTEIYGFLDLLVGALVFKVVFMRQSVGEAEIGRLVDMLLGGVPRPISRAKGRKA